MNRFSEKVWPISQRALIAYIIVFAAYLIAAKFSYYIFFAFDTNPALIWPPVGIGLAATILFGYRMWLPIFLAHLIATATEFPETFFLSVVIAGAYALQAVAGRYIFLLFGFESAFEKLRNTLIFIIGAFLITMIEPTIATGVQIATGTLWDDPQINWARSWGAGLFSALVYTPFFLFWSAPFKMNTLVSKERLELLAAFTALALINYIVFWTDAGQFIGISIIFLLPAVLIWFALRLHPRWLTLATFITSIQGVAGMLITPSSNSPISEQLLAAEIYICLIAAIFYVFAAVVDERRTAYKELQYAYKVTSESDKAKNEFIAILAHELRNPLAPIISSLELLHRQDQDPQTHQILEDISHHAAMIRRLLDDLLDLDRLSQNKIRLQKEDISATQVVRQSLASVTDHAQSRQLQLIQKAPDNDVIIFADPVRLKQILINLLNNACKYTEPGGTVTLSYGVYDNTFFAKIEDTGIGIHPELIEHIFEPFRQLADGSNYGTGLGIGLFLTQRLVEIHDGSIEVHSDGPGKGSTFTVRIPLPVVDRPKMEVQLPKQSEHITHSTSPLSPLSVLEESTAGDKRILIVDDNEAAANVLQKLLKLNGYTTEVAYSGKQALAHLTTFDPHVVFLDIGMPVMDGYQTAQEIKKSTWRGAIVALSGYGQESDKEKTKAAGFDHHLVKPVGIEDIESVIAHLKTE